MMANILKIRLIKCVVNDFDCASQQKTTIFELQTRKNDFGNATHDYFSNYNLQIIGTNVKNENYIKFCLGRNILNVQQNFLNVVIRFVQRKTCENHADHYSLHD